MKRQTLGTIAALLLLSLPLSISHAQVFKTQEQALKEVFADSDTVLRKTLFLTDDEAEAIEELARARVESKILTYYEGVAADSTTGFAFFETNIVRTKPETFMVVVTPDWTVRHVEILAFHEPADYLPTPRWLRLFEHKVLDEQLWPKRGIDNITGATLSVRAITQGVRKMLATYKIAIMEDLN